ncbi:MAG TPA: histidine--tRNA ligase [Vicinamibacterales bacterium]|nr:histidine--tRNA ligase [Vicinamibacterales bacterium]
MDSRTQPARGMRDFLAEDVRRREHVIGVITRVYRAYGFEPLETPAVENIETLLGKYGEEGNKLIFKILRRGEHEAAGEADLALRYDLTVPLARVVAEHRGNLPRVFKRYQIQPVWRADRPARGRFREFYQCDVDIVGSRSMVVEAELCAAVADVLRELGFSDFTIRLNHRLLLRGMLNAFGIGEALHDQALIAVDKLDKIGHDGVARELSARGIPDSGGERLLATFEGIAALRRTVTDPRAFNDQALERLRASVPSDEGVVRALAELEEVAALGAVTSAARHLTIDPSLARGLSYYTGSIFEIAVTDLAGSLGGGGRYDGLIGMFSGEDVPACGFSLGLERILVVMAERKMFPETVMRASADVLVTLFEGEPAADALALAALLRQGGLRVDVYPEPDRIGKQLKFASGRNIRFAAIVGESERRAGRVTIKDLDEGGQETVARDEAAAYLRRKADRVLNLKPEP